MLAYEVRREPLWAAPLPAGTVREVVLAAQGDQMELCSADCGERSGSIACSLLPRGLKRVQAAPRAAEEREEAAVVR